MIGRVKRKKAEKVRGFFCFLFTFSKGERLGSRAGRDAATLSSAAADISSIRPDFNKRSAEAWEGFGEGGGYLHKVM